MVSPTPLSDFVPDVTLIAFPIPVAIARGGRALSSRESPLFRVRKMVLILVFLSEFRRKPEFSPLRSTGF
jgi:hypothetical protein